MAADVLRCLGYSEGTIKKGTTACLRVLDEDQKRVTTLKTSQGGVPAITVISESGLYALTMRAQKRRPEVKGFQDYVTREVLPSIRKTGSYVTGQPSLVENPKTDPLELAEVQKVVPGKPPLAQAISGSGMAQNRCGTRSGPSRRYGTGHRAFLHCRGCVRRRIPRASLGCRYSPTPILSLPQRRLAPPQPISYQIS